VVEGGLSANLLAGRRGLATSSPPQLGHTPPSTLSAHVWQKVHSNEQMRASVEAGGKSVSQHSQLGRSSSIFTPYFRAADLRENGAWSFIAEPIVDQIKTLGN
jgi:hypothetical protein